MLYVSAHYLGSIIEKCAALGINRARLISILPDGVDTFSDGLRRYPAQVLIDIYATAKRLSGYENLAVLIGEQLNVSSMNVAGKLLPLCDTMGHVTLILSRYHRLTQTFGETRIVTGEAPWSLVWEPHYDDIDEYADVVTAVFTGFIVAGRGLSYDAACFPLTLEFRSPQSLDVAAFCHKHDCTIKFGMPQDRIVFSPGFLRHKLASSNPQMFDVMSPQVDRLLYQVDDDGAVTARVAASIRSRMREGAPRLEQTAADLKIPVRRMRAALTAAGTTFRKTVDAERKDVCRRLAKRGLKKSDIAFRLGFHDQPAFNRAYRRWYGTTPP